MPADIKRDSHILFVCEGAAEQFMVELLWDADAFVVPKGNIIGITRLRKATQVEENFLNLEYDWDVVIVRVIDSPKEKFTLGRLYRDRFKVVNVYTRPEAEMLVVVNERRFEDYGRCKSNLKPSEYCIQKLGMKSVKSREFLKGYWSADTLYDATKEYKRLKKLDSDELCLADLLK